MIKEYANNELIQMEKDGYILVCSFGIPHLTPLVWIGSGNSKDSEPFMYTSFSCVSVFELQRSELRKQLKNKRVHESRK